MLNRTNVWCDRIIVFSFYALSWFLPISKALIESFAGFALLGFFIKRGFLFRFKLKEFGRIKEPLSALKVLRIFLKSFQPVKTPLRRPIGIYILMNFLSLLFSQHIPSSIEGFFCKVLENTFIYFTFVESFKTKRQVRNLMGIFILSNFLIVINGFYQYWKGQGFIFGQPLMEGTRMLSCFNHSNEFGAYLIVVIMFLFFYLGFWKSFNDQPGERVFLSHLYVKIFLLLWSVVALGAIGLTFSRGVWVSLTVGLAAIVVYQSRMMMFALLVAVVFWMVFTPQLEKARNVSFVTDNVEIFEYISEKKESAEKNRQLSFLEQSMKNWGEFGGMGRKFFWSEAEGMIRQHPIIGSGVNTYLTMLERNENSSRGYPHNCYLQMTAEIGLLGLGSFLWIFFVLFRCFTEQFFKMKDVFLKIVAGGFATGLLGFMFHSALDTNFYSLKLGTLMWLVLAIITTAIKIDHQEASES